MTLWRNLVVALVAAFALAACSSSSDNNAAMDETPPPVVDTTVDDALAAIRAAPTAEEAQAAYDAVKDDVSATQGETLQAAVDARIVALATMARADMQRAALMSAAGMIDTSDLSTQDLVDAAKDAIVALRGAIAAAVDVDDTSMYQSQLDAAVAAVDDAQGGIDTDTRRMNQMTALSGASETLQAALAALAGPTLSQELVDAASSARSALTEAITGAADLTDTEKAPYQREADNAAAPIQTAQDTFNLLTDEAEDAANAAMAVTAAKLYAGIGPEGAADGTIAVDAGTALAGANDRAARYNDPGVPSGTTPATLADTRIMVGIGTDNPVALTEDKKTMVADLHGWEGKRYTAEPDDDGMYEAMVYSDVRPTQGKKFGSTAAVTDSGDFAYRLTGDGFLSGTDGTAALEIDTATDTDIQMRVASSRFDQSAGVKTFKKGDNDVAVLIPGMYHGVAGTYRCAPAGTTICASRVAADGFQLGTVASAANSTFTAAAAGWTFKPSDPNARVMDTADTAYASYGWWIHRSEDGSKYTASAFVDVKGGVSATTLPAAAGLTALQGTATYMGGAAGKYALSSSTGGTNDAGHFTARATLNADFSDNSITGTINGFVDGDGNMKDWSVELKEAAIADGGGITRADGADQLNNDTVWTISEGAAAASGEWSGTLYDNGDDSVPKVGTGTFYTEYGSSGKMVGAFGVNKQ